MVDWTASMQQTFEYYIVDPNTWANSEVLNNVKSCGINRDSSVETLGSATIDITESVGPSSSSCTFRVSICAWVRSRSFRSARSFRLFLYS